MADWKLLAITLSILDALIFCFCIAVFVVLIKDRNRYNNLLLDQKNTCIPCGSLPPLGNPSSEETSVYKHVKVNGREQCCLSTEDKLRALVDFFVEEQYHDEIDRQAFLGQCARQFSNTPIRNSGSARVVDIVGFNDDVVKWNNQSKQSFLGADITYTTNGCFKISTTGFYYIYSQMTFLKHANMSDQREAATHHSIYRQRLTKPKGETEKLAERIQSKCQLQTSTGKSTSYIGAVFYVEQNEEVMIKVTNPTKLVSTPHENYFGLHII